VPEISLKIDRCEEITAGGLRCLLESFEEMKKLEEVKIDFRRSENF